MKKIIFTAAILMGCIFAQTAKAQVSFHLNLNIGSQPDWGPVGYEHASYYYIPDIDAYYDVDSHGYIYQENNIWVHRTYLPVRYRDYNLYNGYKVVINSPNPWLRATYYRTHYASYRGHRGQAIIRNSHDVRYRNHWQGPGHVAIRHEAPRPVRQAPGHGFSGRGGSEYGNPGHGPGGFGHDGGNHGNGGGDHGNHGGGDHGNHGGGDHGNHGGGHRS